MFVGSFMLIIKTDSIYGEHCQAVPVYDEIKGEYVTRTYCMSEKWLILSLMIAMIIAILVIFYFYMGLLAYSQLETQAIYEGPELDENLMVPKESQVLENEDTEKNVKTELKFDE